MARSGGAGLGGKAGSPPEHKAAGPIMTTRSIGKYRLAAILSAVLLAGALNGAIPARAESLSQAQPASPLALARHFQALTEGGLFSPTEGSASDRGNTFDAQQSRGASTPALILDRDSL
jgi:hypothetical protein